MLQWLLHKYPFISPVAQGAVGSALFWIILKILQALAVRVRRFIGDSTVVADRRRKFQEWVYRRFTSRGGTLNVLTGTQIAVDRAFAGLLQGMMFVCVALLFGGLVPVVPGICLVGAFIFFASALTWLTPSKAWMGDNVVPHCRRVADLEQKLFGSVEERTKEILAESLEAEAKGHKNTHEPKR